MRWLKGTLILLAVGASRYGWAYDAIQLKQTIVAPASVPSFYPTGMAVEPSGRIWVTDARNDGLFLFSETGEWIKSVGGRGAGAGEWSSPHGIALDSEGMLYVADTGNHRIQVLSPDGKPLFAFGERGSGPGQFSSPGSIAVSPDGVVIVADKGNRRLQLFSREGVFLQVIDVGSDIEGLAVDVAGRLYTVNTKLHQVEQWSTAGQLLHSFTGSEPSVHEFDKPQGIAVNPFGLLYVTDSGTQQFRELDGSGHTLGTFGHRGSGNGEFDSPDGIAVSNDTVYVCDTANHRIVLLALSHQTARAPLVPQSAVRLHVTRLDSWPVDTDWVAVTPQASVYALSAARGVMTTFDKEGKSLAEAPVMKTLSLRDPSALISDSAGDAMIVDAGANRVFKCDNKGTLLSELGKKHVLFQENQGEFSKPQGLALSSQGSLFVADTGNSRLQAFNDQGLFLFEAGQKGSGPGELKSPVGIAWDKDRLYVSDTGNRKIVVFNASGRYLHEMGGVGPETLEEPRQLALDREGNLFVLDTRRARVLVYDAQGIFLGGFGCPGKAPGFLNHPRSFALNDDGLLILAEEGRMERFRVVLLPPAPTSLQATPGDGYVQLKWEPVKSRFPAKYIVYRSTLLGRPERVKESVETTLIDDTLTPNTTYSYTVVSQSVQGASSVPSMAVLAMAKTTTTGPRLEIVSADIADVFSAHYKFYGRSPVGHVTIRNNGTPPVQKIKVSFAIQGYMDFPSETAIAELHSGEQKEVPLLVTFNNRILEVNETTPIQAQVRLTFYQNDQENSVIRNLPFKLYSRNTIRWDNKERVAAFITPNDPPVIDFSRRLALPFVEAHPDAPVLPPLLTAWALFEGLGAQGISYAPRPNNPYDRVSLDSTTVDSVQFARETLSRKSGDCADVVALVASCLESLTVTTCALDAPGHLFLMLDVGETQKEALGFPETMFVYYAGSYWIPLEATDVGASFMEAWKQGAEEYRRWSEQGKISIIDIHHAWKTFEPVTLPDMPAAIPLPRSEILDVKLKKDWRILLEYHQSTTQTAAEQALAASPKSGEPLLRLGFLAADFKHYDEARDYFLRARADPLTAAAAFNNLGNLAFLQGDWSFAESRYKQAQEKDPTDAGILVNLARVYLKQGLPQKAAQMFARAAALDPSVKEQYGDVSSLGQ